MTRTLWVICPDNHTEGLGEPISVSMTEEAAKEAMEFLTRGCSGYRSFKLIQVPVFPPLDDRK